MTHIDFSPSVLRNAAAAKAGHDDFGSDSYMPGLEALLYSIEHEAQLNAVGRAAMWNRIVSALANRATVVAWEKADPVAAGIDILAPLVIVGLPRTGSSILHETLSAAPGARTPLIWETSDFQLAHAVADARSDDRIRAIEEAIAHKNSSVPGYHAIHYENPFIPMECAALMILDLFSAQFPTMMRTYCRHLLSEEAAVSAYEWHLRALRYLQAGKPGVRWVLKAPVHSAHLGALLASYPDAMIVQTHRDPLQVIGSYCSLNASFRHAWSDATDAVDQAQFDTRFVAEVIGRAVDFRQSHVEAESRIHDVSFRQFMADPGAVIAGVYDYFGMAFPEDVRAETVGYFVNRPREKHGRHAYSLDDFGLTPALVDDAFKRYSRHFARYF